MTHRKKPGIAFWTAVIVALLLAYPALLGPCCWMSSRTGWGGDVTARIYRPLFQPFSPRVDEEPGRELNGLTWWSELGAKVGWHWSPKFEPLEGDFVIRPETEWAWTDFNAGLVPID